MGSSHSPVPASGRGRTHAKRQKRHAGSDRDDPGAMPLQRRSRSEAARRHSPTFHPQTDPRTSGDGHPSGLLHGSQRHPVSTTSTSSSYHPREADKHSSSPPLDSSTLLPLSKAGRPSPAVPQPTSRLHHPFKANFNDHFETSTEALQDVLPFVNELRQLLRPSTPERLTLYDPYYCSGAIVKAWRALGVQHILHENRDFYADIAQNTIPGPYDVLVTNPPFSEDHIWRLLDFLVAQRPLKPWAFVAPDYIASKPQYKAWVRNHFTPTSTVPSPGPAGAVKGALRRPPPPIPSIESILPPLPEEAVGTAASGAGAGDDVPLCAAAAPAVASVGPEPFYIVPRARYDYEHPLGVGHDHSHFKSMWYVWAGRHTSEVLRGVTVALSGRGRNAAPSRASSSSLSSAAGGGDGGGAGGAPVTVVNGYQALVEGHHVAATDRRLNPERLQRAAAAPARGGRGRR
ncbi:hypothetical protein ABL78_7932 [Leptomonas seymouri]|uniref:Uncharacterized protein n=1 Tax=Leptomonas seymouri TaxID=5684 RepID=A0A0N0P2K1_LEPSE|nr:hypothetical protein ABL78_7932 [Leptomonas seymouri]|eukprot:KPI83046.1 hypothetical protein ABL78_7932 [Leptomonas seymouri]